MIHDAGDRAENYRPVRPARALLHRIGEMNTDIISSAESVMIIWRYGVAAFLAHDVHSPVGAIFISVMPSDDSIAMIL